MLEQYIASVHRMSRVEKHPFFSVEKQCSMRELKFVRDSKSMLTFMG